MPDYTGALPHIALTAAIGCAELKHLEPGELDREVILSEWRFGEIVWWFWRDQQLEQAAIDVIAVYVSRLAGHAYGFDSVLKAVLRGLEYALPPHVEKADYIAIRDAAYDGARYRA